MNDWASTTGTLGVTGTTTLTGGVESGLTVNSGDLTVTTGNLDVSTGNLAVATGNLDVTAGGATIGGE